MDTVIYIPIMSSFSKKKINNYSTCNQDKNCDGYDNMKNSENSENKLKNCNICIILLLLLNIILNIFLYPPIKKILYILS